jgi:hypothetical protein
MDNAATRGQPYERSPGRSAQGGVQSSNDARRKSAPEAARRLNVESTERRLSAAKFVLRGVIKA